jgi:hypothetical protein
MSLSPPLPALPWPLSFLQLNDYLNCPKKLNHKHVAKDAAEVKSWQQKTGIDAHEALKRRLKLGEPLMGEMATHEPAAAMLLNQHGILHVELALGCTADGLPCSFFDNDICRLRARVDVCLAQPPAAFVCDWKTGKPWEDPLELKIQALLLRIHYPELTQFTAGYYWLRNSVMGKLTVIDDVQRIWGNVYSWSTGIANRIAQNDWPADENPLCPWCPCSKQQCQFKKDPPK